MSLTHVSTSCFSVSALVALLKKNIRLFAFAPLFVTISPNPNTLHKCLKVNRHGKHFKIKMKYGNLKQDIQYDYCMRILNRCYLPFLSKKAIVIGRAELNKQHNIHFHVLIWDDRLSQNDVYLNVFRRDISNCELVMSNCNKNKKDFMNNIVRLNKPLKEVVEYLDKDYDDSKDLFKSFHYPDIC